MKWWPAPAAALVLAACSSTPAPAPMPPPKVVAKVEPVRTDPKAYDQHRPPPLSPYAPAREDVSKRGQVVGDLYRPDIKDGVPDHIPDVDRIPEPKVRREPLSRIGNRLYSVLGRSYKPLADARGYVEEGRASYYGNKFHGRLTSNEEVYDMYAFTAAHRTLPLPSFARVTNLENGKSVVVRVNDRGPFHGDRLIDLSYSAAVKLGYRERGTARVRVEALTPQEERLTEQAIVVAEQAKNDPAAREVLANAVAAGKVPAGVALTGSEQVLRQEYRFDMKQDGKAMSSAEFDAWMKARGLRVATGVPGKPVVAPAVLPAVTPPSVTNPSPAPVTPPTTQHTTPAAASVPATQVAAAASNAAATTPLATNPPTGVTLQIASFANQTNAQHALDMLMRAGIANARVVEGEANGRRVWRLRVGPANSAELPELSARIAGLGFGPPNPVRD